MKRLFWGTTCLVLLTSAAAMAGQGMKETRRTAKPRPEPQAQAARTTTRTTTGLEFSVEHVRIIRAHYAPKYRHLPPGLQKKYARTGQLPPGWQKKMEPLPVALERQLPPLPAGYRRGVIDGHAVIYSSRSGTIVDVAVLF